MRRGLACALAATALPWGAAAQEAPEVPEFRISRPVERPVVPEAVAEPLARPRIWHWTPRITLREEYSDNVRHVGDDAAQSAWTTFVTPGIHLEHWGPRLRISGDYAYQRSFHTSSTRDLDETENLLYAIGGYDLVDKTVVIDARASITQENRNAFAAPVVPGSTNPNANRSETRLFTLSPVARGQFGDVALWQARWNESVMRSEGNFEFGDANLDTSEVILGLRSARTGARLGWNLEATGLQSRSDTNATLYDRRVRADLIIGIVPQLNLLLIEGYEKTDFTREGESSGDTPGAGFNWAPSPRTVASAIVQRRFFGTGHLATFDHRTPRTAWRVTSTKDSTVLTSVLGATAGTFQSLMDNLLLYSIRDPGERSEAARARLNNLGYAPTAVSTGFLTERPFIYNSQDVNFTFLGTRTTFVAGYQRREQTALGTAAGIGDSFTLSEEILQRSYRTSLNYRLTPLTSFTAAFAGTHTRGVAPSNLSSREDLGTLYVSSQLGPRMTGSVGYRRVDFESNQATSYRDNVLFATIEYRLN
jgi:uncharacterized protein (PEP-CTERM system associated)